MISVNNLIENSSTKAALSREEAMGTMSIIPEELIHKILMHSYLFDYPQREDLSSQRVDADKNCFEYSLIGFPPDKTTPTAFSIFPTFLKLRRLNKRWRTVVDTFLKIMWKDLSHVKPLTSADITLIMSDISSRELSIVRCFQRLTLYFINSGAQIREEQNLMSIRICEYRVLQDQAQDAQDTSLQIIWKHKIMERFSPDSRPTDDASATQIRVFLNNPIHKVILSSVKVLDLIKINLKTFPVELQTELKELVSLTLFENQLQAFSTFFSLSNLRVLDLSHNQLQEFSASLLNFPNLETLDLSYNQLRELSGSFNFSDLRLLNLSNNRLKELPESLNSSNFRTFDLSNNQLENLPASLNFLNLQQLNLSYNRLKELPASLNFSKLEELSLLHNQLKELSASLNFSSLTDIKLDGNMFIFISDQVLNKFKINKFISLFISKLSYSPKFPLSKFCHAIMRKAPLEEQKELFFLLDPMDRNAIYECIWKKAGSPDELGWREKHAFDDMVRFRFAVHERILEKLHNLPKEEKAQVEKVIREHLARSCDLIEYFLN